MRVTKPALLLSAVSALVGALSVGCDSCGRPAADAPEGTADGAPSASASATAPRAAALPSAAISSFVNPQRLPAYSGPTGSVEGTIYVTGDRAPESAGNDYAMCPDGVKTYGHWFREGPPAEDGKRWLADAIVAVTGYAGYYVPAARDVADVTIEGCAFTGRTLAMTIGQRIQIQNKTAKDFWTPILEPGDRSILRMATPGGDPISLFPQKPGRYRIFDHDRKYAYVDVFVMMHPLHTTTALGGTYRIDGVPVGKLKVNTSHPRFANVEASADVEIQPNVVKRVDLTLEYKVPVAAPALSTPRPTDGGHAGGPPLQPYPGQK